MNLSAEEGSCFDCVATEKIILLASSLCRTICNASRRITKIKQPPLASSSIAATAATRCRSNPFGALEALHASLLPLSHRREFFQARTHSSPPPLSSVAVWSCHGQHFPLACLREKRGKVFRSGRLCLHFAGLWSWGRLRRQSCSVGGFENWVIVSPLHCSFFGVAVGGARRGKHLFIFARPITFRRNTVQ